MKKKTMLVIGILGILLVLGAVVALAQNTNDQRTKDEENHECSPEMIENMSENCPEQMMQSGACENMMNGEKGHSGMMGGSSPASKTDTEETDHCGEMNSDMGSMMGSNGGDMKDMM